jgi:hypothetical protein
MGGGGGGVKVSGLPLQIEETGQLSPFLYTRIYSVSPVSLWKHLSFKGVVATATLFNLFLF